MLNHYSLLLETAYLRQQEMFRQAEAERLYRQITENRPSLRQQVGHRLLATVQHFKVNLRSNLMNKLGVTQLAKIMSFRATKEREIPPNSSCKHNFQGFLGLWPRNDM